MKFYSPYQFAIFRILLGVALFFYFISLLPYAPDMTETNSLAIPLSKLRIPNPLFFLGSIQTVKLFMLFSSSASIFLSLGIYRRILSCALLIAFICTISALPIIPTPRDGFATFLLLILILIPAGEPLSLVRARENWHLPQWSILLFHLTFPITFFVYGWNKFMEMRSAPATVAHFQPALLFMLAALLQFFQTARPWAWLATTIIIFLYPPTTNIPLFLALIAAQILYIDRSFRLPWLQKISQADVFIDGECVLCHGFAQFLLQEDQDKIFRIASLQGKHSQASLPESYRSQLSTVVLKIDDRIYKKSAAVLRIVGRLGGIWTFATLLLLIPAFLRDLFYDLVARFRYRIFGKLEYCMLPRSQDKGRVLD